MISIKLRGFETLSKQGLAPDFWGKTPDETISKLKKNLNSKYTNYLGWLDWPRSYDKREYETMKKSAKQLRSRIDILLVIGIGGSYLGARAADTMVRGLFPNDDFTMLYVGHTMSSTYTEQLKGFLRNKRYGICVISKSGTTMEPAIAFRIFEQDLINKVGQIKAEELIVAVTDQNQGFLKKLAQEKNYQTFVIPNDIGGRFSVLTPVGIYPLMVAGIDTDSIITGAQQAMGQLGINDKSFSPDNVAYRYALLRYQLYKHHKFRVESLVTYEAQMQFFAEWWKQLFGESEGKNGRGILPTTMIFSTDLHSLGQWIQEGTRGLLFETVLDFKQPVHDLKIPSDSKNYDQLNYLEGKRLHEINRTALKGTVQAHIDAKVPNIILEIDGKMDALTFGYLVYFFELATAFSACLLEVHPFNQPGVEVYKKNMFQLLGKS